MAGRPSSGSARDMAFFRSLPPTPPEYRNEKALADLMLGEHAFGYVGGAGSCAGLRRGDRDPDAGRGDPPGPRAGIDGHRRGHRLQHRLRQHLSLQPVPRAVDELAVRERPGRGPRHPRPLGRGGPSGPPAVGPRRRRRDVRHRLPGAVADGRVRRRHQGPRPRHAGLLEHRRPGVDRLVRRPGDEALGLRQGAPRAARAAQGAWPDPRWRTARSTSRRRRRPTSTTSTGRSWRRTRIPARRS